MSYRGRFAPSPTGPLHLGLVTTALIAWLRARQCGGAFVMRIEDLDTPRVVAGSEAQQLADLQWLGLAWDEGPDVGGAAAPYRQSARSDRYEDALAQLAGQGATYLCDCSRRDIAGIASAPHAGEDGPRYPGTCRRFGMQPRVWKRPPAIRLAVPERDIAFDDVFQGAQRQAVAREVGDFVLKRGDGVYAYQLAVVVDDLAMRISEVVRGADLLGSTARQILLAEMLGGRAPQFAHVPLVVDAAGARLQKRAPSHTLAGVRAAGTAAPQLLARLAAMLGLFGAGGLPAAVTAADLVARADLGALRGRAIVRLPA
jgi:glutamyl-tRNA synthetase